MSSAKATHSAPKVLVVDDDSDIVELLEYNLIKEGYSVQTASNGRKAIETAKTFIPDLILLDIMMPQLDGIETGRILRAAQAAQHGAPLGSDEGHAAARAGFQGAGASLALR